MVKSRRNLKNSMVYVKFFISIVLVVVMTICILSIALYFNFEKMGRTLVHNYAKDALSQLNNSATNLKTVAAKVLVQISMDSNMTPLFYNNADESPKVKQALDQLQTYVQSVPYVHSIYIFNSYHSKFFTTYGSVGFPSKDSFFDKQAVDMVGNLKKYPRLEPIPRIIEVPEGNKKDPIVKNCYTFFYHEGLNLDEVQDYAIILNFSLDWMKSIVNSMGATEAEEVFIMDTSGSVILPNSEYSMLTDISKLSFAEKVLKAEDESGYFIEKIDGTKTLVTYVKSEITDWKFIRLTPYNHITYKIDSMRRTTLSIAFGILLIGCLITLVISKKLSTPVNAMIEKLSELEREKNSNQYIVKQKFLNDVIKGHLPDGLDSRFIISSKLNLKVDLEQSMNIILFRIDRFKKVCEAKGFGDIDLFRFAIMNISGEIFSRSIANETVDLGEDHIAVLFNTSLQMDKLNHDLLDTVIGEVQKECKELLQIPLTVVVSETAQTAESLASVYENTIKASEYRMKFGHESIIRVQNVPLDVSMQYNYPINKEKAFIDAMMLEKIEDARKIFDEIVSEAGNYSPSILHLTVSRLAIAISMVIDTIRKNTAIMQDFEYTTFLSQINQLETIQEINEEFYLLLEIVNEKMEERKNSKSSDLINKTLQIIHSNLSDKNLCINMLADMVNFSPGYLGQLFKKSKNKYIPDYISEIRIEKATQLLNETSLPINEIADQVGFTSTSYFYTLFKKNRGMTPSEFRQKGIHEGVTQTLSDK